MNNLKETKTGPREKIRELIKKNLAKNPYEFETLEDFTDDDNIFQLGISNSLFVMKLLNFVEKEFNIEVASDELEIDNFSSVNNVLKLVERMQKNQETGN
jgi:acyl carrier protein